MNNQNYINAEIMFMISQLPYSKFIKIPKEYVENIFNNIDLKHYKMFDKNKTFYKQNISEEALLQFDELCSNYFDDYNE